MLGHYLIIIMCKWKGRGTFDMLTDTDFSGRLSIRLTHYNITNQKFQYKKAKPPIYFKKAA